MKIARFGVADDVELTSAHVPLLFHVKRINPKLRTGIFFHPLPDWMEPALGQEHVIGWMMLTNAQVAHLPSSLIEKRFIQRLRKRNFLVYGSNLNTEREIREAIMLGIDEFSTDQLELALDIRKELRESL